MRNYLEHLQYLELKKLKHKEETRKDKEAESQLSYNDYDWDDMYRKGTLKKNSQSVAYLFRKAQAGKQNHEKRKQALVN